MIANVASYPRSLCFSVRVTLELTSSANITPSYRRVPKCSPYGSVCCACAQRPGLPRACHSGELACLALQAVLSAHVACAPRARLRQAFSRTLTSQKTQYFSMGPKLRYPPVHQMSSRLLLGIHSQERKLCSDTTHVRETYYERTTEACSYSTASINCSKTGGTCIGRHQ